MSYILPMINTSHIEIKKNTVCVNNGLSINEIVLNKSLFDYLSSSYDYIKHRKINIKKNNISFARLLNSNSEHTQLSNPSSFLTLIEIINMLKEHTFISKNKYNVANFGRSPTDFKSAFNIIFNPSNVSCKYIAESGLNVDKYELLLYLDSVSEELDYNKKEATQSINILDVISRILRRQSVNGTAVFKVYDLYTSLSLYILYLLSAAYKHVYIFKPVNDDCECSEKYIICDGFRLNDEQIIRMTDEIECVPAIVSETQYNYIDFCSRIKLPFHYISKLNEINSILGQQCLEHVNHIINFSNASKSNNQNKPDCVNKKNQYNCDAWCKKHNIMYVP